MSQLHKHVNYGNGVIDSDFCVYAIERQLTKVRYAAWATPRQVAVPSGWTVLAATDTKHEYEMLLQTPMGAIAIISLRSGWLYVRIAAVGEAVITLMIDELAQLYPTTSMDGGTVPVQFWSYAPDNTEARTRRIKTPEWSVIRGNYAVRVRDRIDHFVQPDFRPSNDGRLLLWRGEPGTGKTYAVRALIWEWREWAQFHYITDPDHFFGQHADYMMNILMSEEEDDVDQKWRVLILEDSGELLTTDAKSHVGQGLSRLLNVVDGMIGQGLRVLVLVTTNEDLGALHAAVSRPGRCLLNLEFDKLDPQEVREWFGVRQELVPPLLLGRGARLADLYAAVNGREHSNGKVAMGFTA